jgi:SAM-dependent methyltransferase
MADRLTRTIRENYDKLAKEYALHLSDELQHKPFDREVLTRFAHHTKNRGALCDLGCGPGHVTRFLNDLQAPVFGIDVSPNMVSEARRLNPGLDFREGDMLALDLPSGSVAGIVAFYAIVHLPPEHLSLAFNEMFRALESDGLVLMAFHVGDEIVRPDELWGVPLTMDFYLHQTATICQGLEAAGFAVEEVAEREPYPEVEYQSRRAYIFARKPKSSAQSPSSAEAVSRPQSPSN